MDELKISIVIVNYNVKELLLTCLRSLYHFHIDSSFFEVIVVDNESKDDSCDAIRQEFPQVILIENNTNAGFPKANNQGFEIAKGQYIFMLNPDTEFKENSLDRILKYMEENESVDLLGPGLLNTDGSRQQSVWRFPSLSSVFCESFYLKFLLKKKNYLDKNFEQTFEAESFSGAAIFFRSNVLQKIGNLDETMFWIEDVEFCYRAVKNNLKCVYFPETKILHHIGQSAKKNYNISLSNQIFNKIKFFKKQHSVAQWLLIVAMSYLQVILKIGIFGMLSPFKTVYKLKAQAYLYTLPKIYNPPKGIA
ncbi:MAG: glycosyltransferase family 2 protein [Crocinitomicaceae bacterium]